MPQIIPVDPLTMLLGVLLSTLLSSAPLLIFVALWRIGSYLRESTEIAKKVIEINGRVERLIAERNKL